MDDDNKSIEQERAELAEKALDETLGAAEKKAKEYGDLAQQQRKKYSVAKAVSIVLGVLTPTFVAFQTQSEYYKLLFSIIAICLTAGTGIVAGLLAAFKWGEGFGRSTLASFQLDELVGSIRLESLLYRTTPDYGLKYNEMKRLYEKTWQQMRRTIQTHGQSEIAELTKPQKQIEQPASS